MNSPSFRNILLHCIDDSVRERTEDIGQFLQSANYSVGYEFKQSGHFSLSIFIIVCHHFDTILTKLVLEYSTRGRVLIVSENSDSFNAANTRKLIEAGAADIIHASKCDIFKEIHCRLEQWVLVDSLMCADIVGKIIGHQTQWRRCLQTIVEVAACTEDSVLLTGESGTGKELLARVIHELDRRETKGHYTILDCTTISEGLSGSEFFGHERGAFTNAYFERDGAFALADGGTLFLDEIGELSLLLQAQLLRVIQEGTYRRVGSNVWHRARFRLICATNRNLLAEVEKGRFRQDLYYRIAQWTFRLPSLEERKEDILQLAYHFLKEGKDISPSLKFDPIVEEFLSSRAYPGNVRELRQLVHKIRNRVQKGNIITAGCVPHDDWANLPEPSKGTDRAVRNSLIDDALASAMGLEQIVKLARAEVIHKVLREEFSMVNYDLEKKSLVLKRTKERLKCSLRWVQICAKKHNFFDTGVEKGQG